MLVAHYTQNQQPINKSFPGDRDRWVFDQDLDSSTLPRCAFITKTSPSVSPTAGGSRPKWLSLNRGLFIIELMIQKLCPLALGKSSLFLQNADNSVSSLKVKKKC